MTHSSPAIPAALQSAASWLACPHCGATMTVAGHGLRCVHRHSFDVARQGYVNLSGRAAPANADTAAMVEARGRFLQTGHYRGLADAVAAACDGAGRILDVGAGTGYYAAHALEGLPEAAGLATDVSPAAARRAARAHPRLASVVADTWVGLPVAAGAVDVVLCVFAPRNAPEFRRAVTPGGRVVVAAPGPDHLLELRSSYGLLGVRGDKVADVAATLAGFHLESTARVVQTLALTAPEVSDLIGMGPNAFHEAPRDVGAGRATLDVTVATFRRD